ncbi:MAG TPA: ECF transporter S component [Cellulomonas sp.]
MSTNEPTRTLPAPLKKVISGGIPTSMIVAIIPVCATLNIIGGYVHTALHLPVYIDMIGTAVAAILLGPWYGALTGLITNLVLALISGPTYLAFAIVNVLGGIVWGFGIHKWKMGRSIPRFFLLNVIVALILTVVVAPLTILVYGGATGSGQDTVTAVFVAAGQQLVVSVFSSSLLTTLADKIIAGFVALAIIEAMPMSFRGRADVVHASPKAGVLYALAGVAIGVVMVVGYQLLV